MNRKSSLSILYILSMLFVIVYSIHSNECVCTNEQTSFFVGKDCSNCFCDFFSNTKEMNSKEGFGEWKLKSNNDEKLTFNEHDGIEEIFIQKIIKWKTLTYITGIPKWILQANNGGFVEADRVLPFHGEDLSTSISFSIGNNFEESNSIGISFSNDVNTVALQFKIESKNIEICENNPKFNSLHCISNEISFNQNEIQISFNLIPTSNKIFNYSLSIDNSIFFGIIYVQNFIQTIRFSSTNTSEFSISNLKSCSFTEQHQHILEKKQFISCEPTFTKLGAGSSGSGVRAMAFFQNELHMGGTFFYASGILVNNIAKWNGTSWVPLRNGTAGDVFALAQFQNVLYVGGQITKAGEISTNVLSKWNGTAWSALPIVMELAPNGIVYALKVINSNLFVAGNFVLTSNPTNEFIRRWDGTNWYSLAGGVDNSVFCLHALGDDLYVGGNFNFANNTSVSKIAKWNGLSWSALGSGFSSFVNVITSNGTDIYAGGTFPLAGTTTVNCVARWDGIQWNALGEGANNAVYALASISGTLYLGGMFTTISSTNASRIATWNGTGFSSAQFGSGFSASIYTFLRSNDINSNDIYISGTFTNLNGTFGWGGIAKYGCQPQPTPIPTPQPTPQCNLAFNRVGANGVDTGFVRATIFYQNQLHIAGSFFSVDGVSANNIARFNGTNWQPLGLGSSEIYTLAEFQGFLFVGGVFATAGGVQTNLIAKWDGINWTPFFGLKGSGTVSCLYAFQNSLYIGGFFQLNSSQSNDNLGIVSWNGMNFSLLGSGVDHFVNAMTSVENDLVVGGTFLVAGGVLSPRIAKWNGVLWSGFENGTSGTISALTTIGNDIYAAGNFKTAGGVGANYIAKWNGTWNPLGTGANNAIYALIVINNILYAGGSFNFIGGVSASNFASWNGVSWNLVASGLNSAVMSFTYVNATNDLYLGGTFYAAGNVGARISRYGCVAPSPTPSPTPQPTPIPTPQPTPIPTPVSTSIPTPQQTPIPTNSQGFVLSSEDANSTPIIIGVVVVVIVLACIIVTIIVVLTVRRRRKAQKQSNNNNETEFKLREQHSNSENYMTPIDEKSQYSPLTSQYASTSAITKNNQTTQYETSTAVLQKKNTNEYVSSTTILENSATKKEANELFKKFAIPYSELTLGKELGKGNFGSVYLAHKKSDPLLEIACKQIEAKPSNDTNASTASAALKKETKAFRDFIAEAKALQSIPPSPYVVRFIGLCSEPFCILTEFIDGGSLLDYLSNSNASFTFQIAIGFLKQICKGIAHLHKNGIIHRDLAARNVLLRSKIDEETGVRQCVLVDMGLARLYETGGDYLKTKSPIPLKWSAPEALRDKKFSEKSDIYSFGIIAIECFTRDKPFPKMTPLEVALAISSGRLIPTVKGNCPEELVSIFDACFALDPDQRPTATQMLVSLDSIPK